MTGIARAGEVATAVAATNNGSEIGSGDYAEPESSSTSPPDCGGLTEEEPFLVGQERNVGPDPDLWLYRDRTLGLLRRYMRLAIEVGRLPSLLGREFFRTRITSYRSQTFEDAMIFVHDIERSLEMLDGADKTLIALAALREYSHEETARLLGCTRRTVARFYLEALDRVSEIFLKREILAPLPPQEPKAVEACQGGALEGFVISDSA